MSVTKVLLGAAVSLGVPIAFAPAGSAGRSAAEQTSLPAAAIVARTISLNETGHLRLTGRHNFTLNERGLASGTIAGAIYVTLTAVSSSRVTFTVNIHPPGGSISGSGAGTYRRMGRTAGFSGSLSFHHGTGRYAHAHGSGLSFSGTIQESHNDAITVYVRGRVSD